jgi:murein DD-endopeptidase MepM/ murein hydrolase activator NlpD
MESIIAGQKIGKRKRASELRYRPAAITGIVPYTRGLGAEKVARRTYRDPKGALARLGELKVGNSPGRRLEVLKEKARDLPKPKLAALIAIALVLALGMGLGISALVNGPAFPMPKDTLLPAEDSAQDLLLDYVSPELADDKADEDQDAPRLPPPPVTMAMTSYIVRSGDSIASIAKRFGLYTDTIISANGISEGSTVKQGRELRIPNINGLIYKAHPGDNLAGIAKKFKTDTTKLLDANDLDSETITAGQSIFIPGARLPKVAVAQALGQRVAWPVRGPLSSPFGYRPDPFTGVKRFHAGIDIAVDLGTQVHAAMAGSVEDVGYNVNYGNYVIMNHADGFQTLYGHLSSASVSIGQQLSQGSVVGLSGSTGYSTGPHLHFGLFKRSLALNPLKYLK